MFTLMITSSIYRIYRNSDKNSDIWLRVKKTNKGYGVFALKDYEEGEFVVEYIGELIDKKEYNQRMASGPRRYMFDLFNTKSNHYYIDAQNSSNKSRCINHSCHANCIMRAINIKGEVKLALFTIQRIALGEEITYNYYSW